MRSSCGCPLWHSTWPSLHPETNYALYRLQDPLPYMAKYPQAQVLTSSDHLVGHGIGALTCRHACKSAVLQLERLPGLLPILSRVLPREVLDVQRAAHRGMCCLLQANTTADGGLELFPEAGSAANIGIMLFRSSAVHLAKARIEWAASHPTAPSRLWVRRWSCPAGVERGAGGQDDKVWDQNAFNDLFRRGINYAAAAQP